MEFQNSAQVAFKLPSNELFNERKKTNYNQNGPHPVKSGDNSKSQAVEKFAAELNKHKLSFVKLTRITPRNNDIRLQAINISRKISANEEIKKRFLQNVKGEAKEVSSYFNVSEKVLKQNRDYIVAMVILFSGPFESLQAYVGEGSLT